MTYPFMLIYLNMESNKWFARLGYSLSEATLLGDAAALYFTVANVGTERLAMEQGVQSLISVMKAFGIEANNAMHIEKISYTIIYNTK